MRSEREFCKWLWALSELGKWLHGSCFEDQMKIFSEPLVPSASSFSSVAQVLTLPWCSCSEAQLSRTMEGISIRTSIYPREPRYEVTHGEKAFRASVVNHLPRLPPPPLSTSAICHIYHKITASKEWKGHGRSPWLNFPRTFEGPVYTTLSRMSPSPEF